MAHNEIRPSSASAWKRAIDAADVVLPASPYLVQAAARAGWDSSAWQVVPNAVLVRPDPPGYAERERLRQEGPLRTVSRAALDKGHSGLLEALPDWWNRPAEMVLARADFEFARGETGQVLAADTLARLATVDLAAVQAAVGTGKIRQDTTPAYGSAPIPGYVSELPRLYEFIRDAANRAAEAIDLPAITTSVPSPYLAVIEIRPGTGPGCGQRAGP